MKRRSFLVGGISGLPFISLLKKKKEKSKGKDISVHEEASFVLNGITLSGIREALSFDKNNQLLYPIYYYVSSIDAVRSWGKEYIEVEEDKRGWREHYVPLGDNVRISDRISERIMFWRPEHDEIRKNWKKEIKILEEFDDGNIVLSSNDYCRFVVHIDFCGLDRKYGNVFHRSGVAVPIPLYCFWNEVEFKKEFRISTGHFWRGDTLLFRHRKYDKQGNIHSYWDNVDEKYEKIRAVERAKNGN